MTDTKWLEKVEALLRKAQSSDFAEEADALYAKAQDLMIKHSIDEAMLSLAEDRVDEVIVDTIDVENPYLNQKSLLVNAIGKTNNVKVIVTEKRKGSRGATLTLVGFKSDIEGLKALYASLSIYMLREMNKQTIPAKESARGWRISYINAFATRIGERLREAVEATKKEYIKEAPGSAVVWVDREKQVAAKTREKFPNIRNKYVRSYSHSGIDAGRSAANRANIGGAGVGPGKQRALSA